MTRIIRTEHVYPPIPVRCYDWRAVFDDYDGAPDAGYQPMGYGKTREEAIAELILEAGDGDYSIAEEQE
jgi:hypothetical protein